MNPVINRYLIVALLVLLPTLSFAQKDEFKGSMFKDIEPTNTITLAIQDTILTFHVRVSGTDDIEPSLDRKYYWFHQGELRQTQGNYSGKLLNGKFEKFDR